jgi:hypothetical protein
LASKWYLPLALLSSMKNSGVGITIVSANKRASQTAIGRQIEPQLVEHLISILCCEAPKLGVLVQVLVQPRAQLVDLAALSYGAIEEAWLALNLLMKSPMSNIEVERRSCDPKWFGQAAEAPGMLLLCERLQGVDQRLCPHLDDLLSQVQPVICPCLGNRKEAQRRIEHARA